MQGEVSTQAKIGIQTTAALARHLGLSRWTISRVLNGHPGVKQETVERVQQAMKDLGFSPNPIARGLRGGRTQMIGVCFQELETPVLVKKTLALQRVLRNRGYQAIIEMTAREPELEKKVVHSFTSLKVDGIVLVGSSLDSKGQVVSELAERNIPVVAVDPAGALPFPRVCVNRAEVYSKLFSHLYERMDLDRKLMVLGIHEGIIYGRERLKGIEEEAKAHGLEFGKQVEFLYDPDRQDLFYEYGYDLGEEVLKHDPLPGGILCLNDQTALGLIRRLTQGGVRAPEDVLVTGFDNLDIAQFTTPTLTTMGQQVPALMNKAVEVLLDWIEGGVRPSNRIRYISPKLHIRESTGGEN